MLSRLGSLSMLGLLPCQGSFLDYLKQEYADGCRLILAAAANERYAAAVALNLGISHDIEASNATVKARTPVVEESPGFHPASVDPPVGRRGLGRAGAASLSGVRVVCIQCLPA